MPLAPGIPTEQKWMPAATCERGRKAGCTVQVWPRAFRKGHVSPGRVTVCSVVLKAGSPPIIGFTKQNLPHSICKLKYYVKVLFGGTLFVKAMVVVTFTQFVMDFCSDCGMAP
eukprot:1141962-Pelagomonas_calceolata.AAC.2